MVDMALKRAAVVFGAGLVILFAGAAAWFLTQPQSGDAIRSGTVVSSGVASIGGPFTLIDQTGQTRPSSDFAGRYMMIYFGFTFCPDICPTSLSMMTRALDQLEKENPEVAEKVVPIFITVDPERDTSEALADYATHFHPRMVALTGSVEDIAKTAKLYRVYYAKVEDESSTEYLVDHSSIFYLMGPDGEFVAHFPHGVGPDDIVEGLRRHVAG